MVRLFFCLATLFSALFAYASDYFPLAVGNYWIYQCENSYGVIQNYDSVVILGSFKYRDKDVFVKQEYILNEYFTLIDSGERIFSDADFMSCNDRIYCVPRDTALYSFSDSAYAFKRTYNDGDGWADPKLGITWTAHSIGSKSTPDGQFDSCYFLQIDTFSNIGYWVAPDIGVINALDCPNGRSVLLRHNTNNISIQKCMDKIQLNEICIEPNPASSFFTVDIPGCLAIKSIVLFDINGRIIKRFKPGDHSKYQTNNLHQGVYVISILYNNTNANNIIHIVK